MYSDGSVNLNMGASDIGTGTKTVMAMVVAEELGIDPDAIQIENATPAPPVRDLVGRIQDGAHRVARRSARRPSSSRSNSSRPRPRTRAGTSTT